MPQYDPELGIARENLASQEETLQAYGDDIIPAFAGA